MDEPADIGLINPEASIVAIPVEPEVQTPPTSPLEVKVVEPVVQIVCVPLNTPAFGAAVTVTVRVAVTVVQPPVPVTV